MVPRHFWKSKSNQLTTLKDIEKKLNITTPTDWYKMRNKDVLQHGGRPLLKQYGNSLTRMLSVLYSDVKWDLTRFDRN
jgi:hypothetical protein